MKNRFKSTLYTEGKSGKDTAKPWTRKTRIYLPYMHCPKDWKKVLRIINSLLLLLRALYALLPEGDQVVDCVHIPLHGNEVDLPVLVRVLLVGDRAGTYLIHQFMDLFHFSFPLQKSCGHRFS